MAVRRLTKVNVSTDISADVSKPTWVKATGRLGALGIPEGPGYQVSDIFGSPHIFRIQYQKIKSPEAIIT